VSITKRIICLANSRKRTERCVAGIEILGSKRGPWVRPVTDRPNHEISKKERQFSNGQEPRLLDIIDVPVLAHAPWMHQRENWLLDPRQRWKYVKTIAWEHLDLIKDNTESLWPNGHHTHHGTNDHVPQAEAEILDSSLKLIHVERVQLSVYKEYYRPQLRAEFSFGGFEYRLKVTDPNLEADYFARGDGEYRLGESFLTISLGEPFNDNCYKLAAAIFPKP
jgi:hypothetical protein